METGIEFCAALEAGDLDLIRKVPKSDLHNHLLLGIRREKLVELTGLKIRPFHYNDGGIEEINKWIREEYAPVFNIPGIFPRLVSESFRQATMDGVFILEASIDAGFGHLYGIPPNEVVDTLKRVQTEIAPEVDFRPCLGFARTLPVRQLLRFAEPYLELDYFTSIDLYDDEHSQPVANFREIYRFARNQGLRCTAHTGEFGTAEEVREAVETLNLDAVQHGIAAASSPDVMKWLAERGTTLNICPTSNLVLERATSYTTHPIRILFDHGVRVTINTDDVTLFGQGVSDEFLHLHRAGTFSAAELESIRSATS